MPFGKRFSLSILAGVLQSGLAFLLIPLTTSILDAADFGAYALVLSITGIGTGLGYLGGSFLLALYYPTSGVEDREGLISTMLWGGYIVQAVYVCLILLIWPLLAGWLKSVETLSQIGLILGLAALLLSRPWVMAVEIMALDGRADMQAAIMIAQSVILVAVTLLTLFVLRWGALSLYWANLAGTIVLAVGSFFVLGPFVKLRMEARWFAEMRKIGMSALSGNIAEQVLSAAESSTLAANIGLATVGIYNHSQQYRNGMMLLVNAMGGSIRPVQLEEARIGDTLFENTRIGWRTIQIVALCVGLGFIAIGTPFISWISNDRFTAAAPLAAIWMIYIMIQASGQPAYAVLTVKNQGVYVTTVLTVTTVAGLVFIIILTPLMGINGLMIATLLRFVAHRAALYIRARQYQQIPFTDWWAVIGALMIIAGLAVGPIPTSALFTGLVVLATISTIVLFLNRNNIMTFIQLLVKSDK